MYTPVYVCISTYTSIPIYVCISTYTSIRTYVRTYWLCKQNTALFSQSNGGQKSCRALCSFPHSLSIPFAFHIHQAFKYTYTYISTHICETLYYARTPGCVLLLFAGEEGGSGVEVLKQHSPLLYGIVLAAHLLCLPVSVHVTALKLDSQPKVAFFFPFFRRRTSQFRANPDWIFNVSSMLLLFSMLNCRTTNLLGFGVGLLRLEAWGSRTKPGNSRVVPFLKQ